MKGQTIGIELEMTGITRQKAAEVIVACLGGTVTELHDPLNTLLITASDGREWRVVRDASITPKRKLDGRI